MEIDIDIPVDEDGFVDRACPNCDRRFRWHEGPIGELPEDAPEIDAYYCPYCAEESPADAWWTPEQVENIQRIAATQLLPELTKEIRQSAKDISKSGFLKVEMSEINIFEPTPLDLDDSESLIAVASPCHPYEPTKISSSWSEPVHCLVCGKPFAIPIH